MARLAPLALLLCLLMSACTTDVRTRYAVALDSANTARDVIGHQYDAGVIDPGQFVALDGYEKAVRNSLSAVKLMLGDPSVTDQTIDAYLDMAEAVLIEFEKQGVIE